MSGYRILIVEDNPDTVELLHEQLDDPAYEISSASDGQEAILVVGERAPDLIIMDVMMPHLDGLETSRYLKQRFREHFLPILVLSAKSDPGSRKQGARFGCEEYLGKPYRLAELKASVEALLELGRLENSLRAGGARESDSEDDDTDAGPAEPPERIQERIITLRAELARRQLEEGGSGRGVIARVHIDRILELSPDHEEGLTLRQTFEENHLKEKE